MHQTFKIMTSVIFMLLVNALSVQAQVYKPVNQEFWNDVQVAIKDSNYGKVLKLAAEKMSSSKKDSLENSEAQLAIGQALVKANLSFGATTIFGGLIKN